MGVINVTPNSFYASSRVWYTEGAVARALRFIDEGADIIDIGGESSRPGSSAISADEECKRIVPIIKEIRKKTDVLISVDTHKPDVIQAVLAEGADIINDITGLRFSDESAHIVARSNAYIVLMHMRGIPLYMQQRACYTDVVREVSQELDNSIAKALQSGIKRKRIIIDPGIGFAKTPYHNLLLIRHLPVFKEKGLPVLIGLSRKSFLGIYTSLSVDERLTPTVAANALSIYQGADIIRVHDVKEAHATVRIVDAIKSF